MVQMEEVGRALQHETLSSWLSQYRKRDRRAGPGFTVTAQFSFPLRENPTEIQEWPLTSSWNAESTGESALRLLLQWSPSPYARQLKELLYSQTGESGEMALGWSFHVWKTLQQLHVLTA